MIKEQIHVPGDLVMRHLGRRSKIAIIVCACKGRVLPTFTGTHFEEGGKQSCTFAISHDIVQWTDAYYWNVLVRR